MLGLALFYMKSRDSVYNMCPVFGIIPSSMYVWLDFSLEILLRVVERSDAHDFLIRWPSVSQMRFSSELLQRNRANGSLLRGVFAITDGARMPCVTYGDPDLQNAYWEGFKHAHEVSYMFV